MKKMTRTAAVMAALILLSAPAVSGAEVTGNSAAETALTAESTVAMEDEGEWNKMVKIIVKQLEVGEEKVVPDADFVKDLGADSLDMTEIIIGCEEEFSIEITNEEMEKIKVVVDLYDLIVELLKKK